MMDAVIIQDQRELKPSFITPTQRGRDRLGCACFMTALLMLLPCKSVEAGRERKKKKKGNVFLVNQLDVDSSPSPCPAAPAGPAFKIGWCNNSYLWQDYIIRPSVSAHEVVPWCHGALFARQVNTEVQLLGASQFTVYLRMIRRRV